MGGVILRLWAFSIWKWSRRLLELSLLWILRLAWIVGLGGLLGLLGVLGLLWIRKEVVGDDGVGRYLGALRQWQVQGPGQRRSRLGVKVVYSRDTLYPIIVARVQSPLVEEKLLFLGITLSPRPEC